MTGFPPGSVTGTQHNRRRLAPQADNRIHRRRYVAVDLRADRSEPGQKEPDARHLHIQRFGPDDGVPTLSGNRVAIFQIGSTVTTASNSIVLLSDGAQVCAIYWQGMSRSRKRCV